MTITTFTHYYNINAFAFFDGVTQRVVIDNLKAGVTKACWDDPEIQVSYRECAQTAGERSTNPAHLPPDKLPGLVLDRPACQAVAADIGLSATALVGRLLADTVVDRLSTVRRLLRLREQVGDERLEAACTRALRFDDPNYVTVKRILNQGSPPCSSTPTRCCVIFMAAAPTTASPAASNSIAVPTCWYWPH